MKNRIMRIAMTLSMLIIPALVTGCGYSEKQIQQELSYQEPDQKERLNTILYNLLEVMRIIAILVSPVIPVGAAGMWKQLGLKNFDKVQLQDAQIWGGYPAGTRIDKEMRFFRGMTCLKK